MKRRSRVTHLVTAPSAFQNVSAAARRSGSAGKRHQHRESLNLPDGDRIIEVSVFAGVPPA